MNHRKVLRDLEVEFAAVRSEGPPIQRIRQDQDPDLERMEELIKQLVRFGSPDGTLEEACVCCRTAELFALLVSYHRRHSAGRLLHYDEATIRTHTQIFINGYFVTHHSTVIELSELFRATNNWLAHCAEHDFPDPGEDN